MVYEYANGVRTYASCNTQNGCYGDATSTIFGSKGRAFLTHGCNAASTSRASPPGNTRGPAATLTTWSTRPFSQAIRSGTPLNCGHYMARNALTAVMGQLACDSGKESTWDQVSKSAFVFTAEAPGRAAGHGAAGEGRRRRQRSGPDAGHNRVQDLRKTKKRLTNL